MGIFSATVKSQNAMMYQINLLFLQCFFVCFVEWNLLVGCNMRFFWFLIITTTAFPIGALANMYVMMDDYYIRVVAHPEIQDFYSYGLCKKGFPKHNRKIYTHLHTDCISPEGQFWWHMPNPNGYNRDDRFMLPQNLTDTLLEDDEGRAFVTGSEMATLFIGGSIGAGVMRKLLPTAAGKSLGAVVVDPVFKKFSKWTAKSIGTLIIDGAAFASFWELATSITDKITYTHYQKTIPFTDYQHFISDNIGLNSEGIEVNLADLHLPKPNEIPVTKGAIDRSWKTESKYPNLFQACINDNHRNKKIVHNEVSIPLDLACIDKFLNRSKLLKFNHPMCMAHCFENQEAIRSSLAKVFDSRSNEIEMGKHKPPLILPIGGPRRFQNYTKNPDAGEFASSIYENWITHKQTSEICEMRCKNEWRTPSIQELWFLVSLILAKSNPNELHRILYKFQASPWSSSKEYIRYFNTQELDRVIASKTYVGPCPIGSECDKTHTFLPADSSILKKMSVFELTAKYSKNVWGPMLPRDYEASSQDPEKPFFIVDSKLKPLFDYKDVRDLIVHQKNKYWIRHDAEVEFAEVYTLRGASQNISKIYDEDNKTIDLNSLPDGVYIIKIKFKNPKEILVEKTLVSH